MAIAIDALEWRFLEGWMAEGMLPRLRGFIDDAAFCELKNVDYYRSEYIWTQLVTGKPMEVTRYFGIEYFDPATYSGRGIGPYLGRPWYAGTGIPTIIFDCPQLAIADDVDGIQVTAWGAHGAHYPRASSPMGTLTEIDARHGPHPALGNDFDPAWHLKSYCDIQADWCIAGVRSRPGIARDLMAQRPDWRLFLTSLSEFHTFGHNFWHGVDASHPLADHPTAAHARERFGDVLAAIDESFGELVDGLGDDVDVVLFALHGFCPADDIPSMVLVPELIARLQTGRRFLRVDGDAEEWRRRGCPAVVPASSKAWASNTWLRDRFAISGKHRARNAVRRVLPEGAIEGLKRAARRTGAVESGIPEPIAPELFLSRDAIRDQRLADEAIDWQPAYWYSALWPSMRYFALPTFTDVHVRVNLRGRERDGVVDPADYHATCDEVAAQLRAIRDPRTAEPAVAEVYFPRRDDPFEVDGPDADVLAVFDRATDAIEHPEVGMLGPVPFQRLAAHTKNGFVAAKGPSFRKVQVNRRPAEDLPATLMALLDVAPPDGATGSSLLDAFGAPTSSTPTISS
ncbi:MAG: hypothetical protein JWO37_147 [Acidimicrobiales bacterium]|nr:hypothetical protein [Acidimicrobiales bacterium]